MYAVVNIQGKQFKVQAGQSVYVHRLAQEAGSKVEFNEVLLVDNNGAVSVGKPTVAGASVAATVLSHVKSDKVVVFKKKRRKGYRVFKTHRQQLSKIQIDSIKG